MDPPLCGLAWTVGTFDKLWRLIEHSSKRRDATTNRDAMRKLAWRA
jgi:hypothetical protein